MKMLLAGLIIFEGGLLQGEDLFQAFLLKHVVGSLLPVSLPLSSLYAHLYMWPHLPISG